MNKKKSVLVTLANKDYIDQAKQLFSSVYWNAGWKGDYLLLAQDIPEPDLKWFRDKGIFIKECNPISVKRMGYNSHPPVVFSKFYVFQEEFKTWDQVIFLDADIIVRATLDNLLQIESFGAPKAEGLRFRGLFKNDGSKKYLDLKRKYDFRKFGFNTGVFSFNTSIIEKDTFEKILFLLKEYSELIKVADESILNLMFYKNWERLPSAYNLYPVYIGKKASNKNRSVKTILFHFVSTIKPWKKQSPFYEEWKENLNKFASINLKDRPQIRERTEKEIAHIIRSVRNRLNRQMFGLLIKSWIGLFGIFLKAHFPRGYYHLKNFLKKVPLLGEWLFSEEELLD